MMAELWAICAAPAIFHDGELEPDAEKLLLNRESERN
jgi:hypothetical protein